MSTSISPVRGSKAPCLRPLTEHRDLETNLKKDLLEGGPHLFKKMNPEERREFLQKILNEAKPEELNETLKTSLPKLPTENKASLFKGLIETANLNTPSLEALIQKFDKDTKSSMRLFAATNIIGLGAIYLGSNPVKKTGIITITAMNTALLGAYTFFPEKAVNTIGPQMKKAEHFLYQNKERIFTYGVTLFASIQLFAFLEKKFGTANK